MFVNREKLRHFSLYVAQMVQIKWGEMYKTHVYTNVERDMLFCVSLTLVVCCRLIQVKVIFYSFLLSHVTNVRAKKSCCVSTKIDLENIERRSKAFKIMRYQSSRGI